MRWYSRNWFRSFAFILIIGVSVSAHAGSEVTLTVTPATVRSGENARFEVSGRAGSPLLIAASTANTGLGDFAGQPVLLGPDAFILFNARTDADGVFASQLAIPTGVNGVFFFQAALGETPDFTQAILSNGAQLSIEGLPANPDTVFIPHFDDDNDGIPNLAEGDSDADGAAGPEGRRAAVINGPTASFLHVAPFEFQSFNPFEPIAVELESTNRLEGFPQTGFRPISAVLSLQPGESFLTIYGDSSQAEQIDSLTRGPLVERGPPFNATFIDRHTNGRFEFRVDVTPGRELFLNAVGLHQTP